MVTWCLQTEALFFYGAWDINELQTSHCEAMLQAVAPQYAS